MIGFWIPLGLIIVSVVVIVVVAVRKLPYLRALDVKSSPEEKAKDLKKAIMTKRLTRVGERYMESAKKAASPVGSAAKEGFGIAKRFVTQLEDRYQKLKVETSAHRVNADHLKQLLEEARRMTKDERFGEAEKRYIEILSHDPKNVPAYEAYGEMLMLRKDLDQARETFKFVLKIRPDDASVNTSLGEIELLQGNPEAAKVYFEQAIKKRPNNPKYLDFYVEASIQSGAKAEAKKGLETLRETNPENKKLPEFERRIEGLG